MGVLNIKKKIICLQFLTETKRGKKREKGSFFIYKQGEEIFIKEHALKENFNSQHPFGLKCKNQNQKLIFYLYPGLHFKVQDIQMFSLILDTHKMRSI